MEILDLAKAINERTGMVGKEFETDAFIVAAVLADFLGKKEIGNYYQQRINESWTAYKNRKG